jgi:hypothetical protein
MKKALAASIVILSAIISMPLFSGTATAITGNPAPDQTPYVGIVVLFSDAARQQPIGYCSGFLLSPTVMVTAGHSFVGVQAVSVCFDKHISYAIDDGKLVYYGTSTIYDGTPVSYPQFNPILAGNSELATSDIGLITLDQPVATVTVFPELPTAGFTDSLVAKTDLQIVGYGFQYQTTPRNTGVANSWRGTLSQNSATAQMLAANFEGSDKYLKLTANPSQGKGAVAFGDSGGPVIYHADGQDIVVALNAFVSSANCNGVSYHTRLDAPQVLEWIENNIQQ